MSQLSNDFPSPRAYALCFFLLLFMIPLNLSAQETPKEVTVSTKSADEARVTAYFETTLSDIQEIIAGQQETEKEVANQLEFMDKKVVVLEQEFRRIKGMTRIVRGRPYETRSALQDLRALRKQSYTMLAPAESLVKKLETKQEKIGLLASETDQPWTQDLPASLQDTLKGLKKTLKTSALRLRTLQKELVTILDHVKSIDAEILTSLTLVEKALPGFWKRMLLTSSGQLLSLELWQGAHKSINDWIFDIPTFLQIQLPSSTFEWSDWSGKFLVYWLLLIGTGALTLRRMASTPLQKKTLRAAWIWISLALALMGTFFTTEYRQTSLQLTLIHLSLFYGVMRMNWSGRALEKEIANSSPLMSFFILFAGGTIIQLLGLPQPFLRLSWMVCLGFSFLLSNRQSPPFMLEKGLAAINPYACSLFFLLAFFGWPHLSILTAEIWALLTLFLQLVVVATRILRSSVEQLPSTLPMTIIKGVVVGFGAPLLWIIGFSAIIGWLTMHLGSDFVFQRISTMNLSWGEYSLNFFRIAIIIVLFYLTHAFGNIWGQILDKKYFRWSRVDPGIIASLQTTGGYAIWIISGIIAFNIMGIRLTSLAVIAGGLSVGIGFGLQNLINNFISGLILLFGRTIQGGDVIQLEDLWGSVRKINIRNTEIQTFDNSIIFVPNSELISGRLINWTHKGDFRLRRDVLVGVAYGSNIELVKKNLAEVAKANQHVLETPAPAVLFKAFGASSLDFSLRVWIDHIDYALTTQSDLHEAIDKAFANAGIEISFPQMDVHVRDTVPFPVVSDAHP